MGGGMHGRGDALAQHTGLGHVMDSFDLCILKVRPVRVLETKAVAEVVELQTHVIVGISLEFDPANLDHRTHLPCSPK